MRILVLSPRLTESRRATLRALTEGLGELHFAGAGSVPDVGENDAIIVDGPQPARPLAFLGAVRSAVERGAALLAIGAAPAERDGFWAELLGVIAGPGAPPGAAPTHPLAARASSPWSTGSCPSSRCRTAR